MRVLSVRVNDQEEKLISSYAQFLGVKVSSFIKAAVIEKIEDAYDIEILDDFNRDYKAGKVKLIPHDEAKEMYGV